jgi:hypothetical protein
MAEMDGLKKRVELVDLRLKKAHSAREKESAALMETWQQIRDRFQAQSAEIIELRGRIAELEDSREDLLKMVTGLLSAVESGLDSMADETVPQIKSMAGRLLSATEEEFRSTQTEAAQASSENDSEPELDAEPAESLDNPNFRDDLLTAIERSINIANDDDYIDDIPVPATAEEAKQSKPKQSDRGKPASPGIRNLISRIEKAVGEEFLEPSVQKLEQSSSDDEDEDDLSRDLREIEELRDELHGLRHRIAAGSL